MPKLFTFSFIILLNFCNCIFPQIGEDWVRRYNGITNLDDNITSAAIDNEGSIYVTGWSSSGFLYRDYCTIKYSANGTMLWKAIYDGPFHGFDYPQDIVIDAQGNSYITGQIYINNIQRSDFGTIKYDAIGNLQWVRTYNGSGNAEDIAYFIKNDYEGNIYVLGYANQILPTSESVLIKYNPQGEQLWERSYRGTSSINQPVDIGIDVNNNIYVLIYSSNINTNTDFRLIKYDKSGLELWRQIYSTTGPDYPNSLTIDENENIIITGYSSRQNSGYDYCTIKYSSSGDSIWGRYYSSSGSQQDEPHDIVSDNSNNIYVTGISFEQTGRTSINTVKYDQNGNLIRVIRYNSLSRTNDNALSMTTDNLNNIYITGYTEHPYFSSEKDFITIKHDPQGNEIWVKTYNGPGDSNDVASKILINNNKEVYIAGTSYGIGTDKDFCLIKYADLSNIINISSEIPFKYSLYQNYPNPFNPITKIRFSIPYTSFTQIAVYDIQGKVIEVLVNKQFTAGTYETDFDASNFPSGVYFYSLTYSDFTETKKMVLIK